MGSSLGIVRAASDKDTVLKRDFYGKNPSNTRKNKIVDKAGHR